MAVLRNIDNRQCFKVVHPLDDIREEKCSSNGIERLKMTRAVRISLGVLRAYLIAMALMLGYHVFDLAGRFYRLK